MLHHLPEPGDKVVKKCPVMDERMGETGNRAGRFDAAGVAKMKNRLLKCATRQKRMVVMDFVNCSAKVGGCFGEKERRERVRMGGGGRLCEEGGNRKGKTPSGNGDGWMDGWLRVDRERLIILQQRPAAGRAG